MPDERALIPTESSEPLRLEVILDLHERRRLLPIAMSLVVVGTVGTLVGLLPAPSTPQSEFAGVGMAVIIGLVIGLVVKLRLSRLHYLISDYRDTSATDRGWAIAVLVMAVLMCLGLIPSGLAEVRGGMPRTGAPLSALSIIMTAVGALLAVVGISRAAKLADDASQPRSSLRRRRCRAPGHGHGVGHLLAGALHGGRCDRARSDTVNGRRVGVAMGRARSGPRGRGRGGRRRRAGQGRRGRAGWRHRRAALGVPAPRRAGPRDRRRGGWRHGRRPPRRVRTGERPLADCLARRDDRTGSRDGVGGGRSRLAALHPLHQDRDDRDGPGVRRRTRHRRPRPGEPGGAMALAASLWLRLR